ncbi:MAG: hypothetical protein ACREUW_18515 [Burkholderiales bacterium]
MKASHASSRGGRSVSLAVKRKQAAVKSRSLHLPHERDESAAGAQDAPAVPRPRIRQAQLDVERGLVDTERRGIPSDVPAPDKERGGGEGA